MQHVIRIGSHEREELIDITAEVAAFIEKAGVKRGLVSVYAQGSTAAVMIQENWDESVQRDVVDLLRKLIPKGVWLHDAQDGNGEPVVMGRVGFITSTVQATLPPTAPRAAPPLGLSSGMSGGLFL